MGVGGGGWQSGQRLPCCADWSARDPRRMGSVVRGFHARAARARTRAHDSSGRRRRARGRRRRPPARARRRGAASAASKRSVGSDSESAPTQRTLIALVAPLVLMADAVRVRPRYRCSGPIGLKGGRTGGAGRRMDGRCRPGPACSNCGSASNARLHPARPVAGPLWRSFMNRSKTVQKMTGSAYNRSLFVPPHERHDS